MGGKLFTTARWLDEFGRHLANADAEYFDIEPTDAQERLCGAGSRSARSRAGSRSVFLGNDERRARVRAELEAEGL